MNATELKEKSVEELNAELLKSCFVNNLTCVCKRVTGQLEKTDGLRKVRRSYRAC